MLVSTAMRPVTAQAADSASIDQHGVEPALALAAILRRDRHAEQPGVLQQLDIVPGILLGAVDLGGALGDRPGRQLAGAGLQLHLIGGETGRVHEGVS